MQQQTAQNDKQKTRSNVQSNNELENVLFIKYNLHIIFVLFYVVPWFVPHTDARIQAAWCWASMELEFRFECWCFNVEAFAFQFTFNGI